MTTLALTAPLELTERGVTTRIATFLPVEMGELQWTLFSSKDNWNKNPEGMYTFALPHCYEPSQLLRFNDTALFVSDTQTGYDDERERSWWRTDIYTAPMTPTAKGWLISQLPTWWDWDYACRTLGQCVGPSGNGREGRFTARDFITDTEWAALLMARVQNVHPSTIVWEPEPRLVWANRQSRISGRPVSLWTDGKVSTKQFHDAGRKQAPGEIELTKAAAKLISIAMFQAAKYWREDERWKGLMMIGSYNTEVIAQDCHSEWRSRNEKRLEQLTTDTGQTLYLVAEEGGALGEDGDSWDHYSLHADLAAAKVAYNEIKL